MIKSAFRIAELPFTKDIDVDALFLHDQFKELVARIDMLCQQKGIGLFTGEVGCGKSTAIRTAQHRLSPQTHRVVYLYRGLDNVGAFYTQLAQELGLVPKFRKSDVANQVLNAIDELYTQQKMQTVLFIDEAHLLKPDILDEIRLLHNNRFDSVDYLSTALIGQPPLRKMLNLTKFLPLRQRIAVSYHIDPLPRNIAYNYFDYQVSRVKPPNPIFRDNAIETIICASKGVPRMINTIAYKAMSRAAIVKKMDFVDQECVMDILDEMGLK